MNPVYIKKADGTEELFEISKLEESLIHSGATEEMAKDVSDHVLSELRDGMTTGDIYRHAYDVLHAKERPVAMRYSLKRAVMELGPSGFPFEKYVAEIFKSNGYEAVTNQIVKGSCVSHEMDVVAWNEKDLIMVEAKFHNDPMMKSDLKVILYVKARFDDLMNMTFDYGGKERKLSEAWLVTNTKFSSAALEYGSCQGGVVMIGWDYPPRKTSDGHANLHDLLIEAKLHPVTCLTTLNGRQKKALIEQGVVLCRALIDNPGALVLAGVEQEDIEKVTEEINSL